MDQRSSLGVASLILGVVGVFTSWLVIGALFGIGALAVGLAARAHVMRGEANNRGTAITGMVLGVVAIVVGLAALALTLANIYYFRNHHSRRRPARHHAKRRDQQADRSL